MDDGAISKAAAVAACAAMALFYVVILYAPTLVLRLPPPASFNNFMIRRFVCAAVSSVVSVVVSALLLPMSSREASQLLGVYGIRFDHIWQAVVFPLSLTALMYAGTLLLKCLLLISSWREHVNSGGRLFDYLKEVSQEAIACMHAMASNVLVWRNYVVAPLTEELVFRACMIPLLLCGGFQKTTVIFLCPIFFSLSHLNHLMEVYSKQNNNLIKAIMIIGLQLGYTVIFGSYASFLFIQTGHFLAPLVAHALCNSMGLPVLVSRGQGVISVAAVAGIVSFLCLLFPMTRPDLYNDRTDSCRCWQGYCSGN